MDLVLNNLQRLICHKTQQTTNQPNLQSILKHEIGSVKSDLHCSLDINELV